MISILAAHILSTLWIPSSFAVERPKNTPDTLDPYGRYIIYRHGAFLEFYPDGTASQNPVSRMI